MFQAISQKQYNGILKIEVFNKNTQNLQKKCLQSISSVIT